MSDEWSQRIFPASYGSFPLHVLSTEDDLSRSLIEHKYPRQDGANVEDEGAEARRSTLDLLFADFLYDGDSFSALQTFMFLLQDGEPHTLVHPLTGAYEARPGQIGISASAEPRVIRLRVEFIEHTTGQAIFEVRAGSPGTAGVEEVRSAAAELDTELAASGSTSTVGSDALTTVEAWTESEELLTRRELDVQLTRIADDIDQEIAALEALSDIDSYPTIIALHRLLGSVRDAAEAILATSPRVMEFTAEASMPLLAICQELYGGALAVERFEQVLRMNRIDNPARIPAGTALTVLVP